MEKVCGSEEGMEAEQIAESDSDLENFETISSIYKINI